MCLKRKALYRRVESYREGTVAMLKLERRRLARQPASQLVRQSQSLRARPFRASQCAVLQWPRYPTQQKRKEGSNAAAAVAAAAGGGGGWWRGRLLAAASEKGPYFFSLAASACLVGRSPFTVLRKVSTFLMPFLEIPGLFRHLCTILFAYLGSIYLVTCVPSVCKSI